MKGYILIIMCFCFLLFHSCEENIEGCTDITACNYDSSATDEDGSCFYVDGICESCENGVIIDNDINDDGICDEMIDIEFRQFIDDQELVFDNLNYENEAGNIYSIERLMYVISDLTLYFENGEFMTLDNYYFINLDTQSTLQINNIAIPNTCVSVSFTYGFSTNNNESNLYINDDDNFHNLMFWPDVMGGGYHYMKLEGRYINQLGEEQFYNTHTGGLNGLDYSKPIDLTINSISEEIQSKIYIDMNINNLYNNPIYNFNDFGGAIMGSSEAQEILQNNMLDVFSATYIL